MALKLQLISEGIENEVAENRLEDHRHPVDPFLLYSNSHRPATRRNWAYHSRLFESEVCIADAKRPQEIRMVQQSSHMGRRKAW